jgi:hypothetical protein
MSIQRKFAIGCGGLASMVVVVVFCLGYFWLRNYVTFEIAVGEEFASRSRLPEAPGPVPGTVSSYPYDWCDPLEFRASPNPQRFFVRVFRSVNSWETPTGTPRLYSVHAFAIEPGHPQRTTTISEQEWANSSPIGVRNRDASDFTFHGTPFPLFGDKTAGELFSPNGKRVAVMSYNSHGGFSWIGNLPSKFSYFVQLYDVESRKLVGAVQGYSHNVVVSCVFDQGPSWINDRYFSIPISRNRDEIMIFDFDRQKSHQ